MAARQIMGWARLHDWTPANPERTTYRSVRDLSGFGGDIEVKQWPNVGSMKLALDMIDRAPHYEYAWRKWPMRGSK